MLQQVLKGQQEDKVLRVTLRLVLKEVKAIKVVKDLLQ
jgi:hypothetical protein